MEQESCISARYFSTEQAGHILEQLFPMIFHPLSGCHYLSAYCNIFRTFEICIQFSLLQNYTCYCFLPKKRDKLAKKGTKKPIPGCVLNLLDERHSSQRTKLPPSTLSGTGETQAVLR